MQDVGVITAIAVLGTVFLVSLVTLLVVVKKRYCKPADLLSRQYGDVAPDLDLVDNGEGLREAEVELDDVMLSANLDRILEDESWAHDAAGLVPHCLAILKAAHLLTEKLVSVSIVHSDQLQTSETMTDLVSLARHIGCRVDDVIRAMYPPLDPRLLEARCSSLHLSVSHLVMFAKNMTSVSRNLDWVDQSLADVEEHLAALREASVAYETSLQNGSSFAGPPSASNDPWDIGGEASRQQAIQLSALRDSCHI